MCDTILQRLELKGLAPIGIMKSWSNGMMGLKEFFTIKLSYSALAPNIPAFQHSLLTFPWYKQVDAKKNVVEFPRR
jgi:hypothetical protein